MKKKIYYGLAVYDKKEINAVNNVLKNSFDVNIIDHTFHHTTFQNLKLNHLVNLEIDVIARYVNSNLTFNNKN